MSMEDVNIGKHSFRMDSNLKANLDIIKEKVRDDWDYVFAVDGIEGSGKSTLAQQAAIYCYPDLTIDDVCFTAEEFMKRIVEAKHHQSIIFDESVTGMFSRKVMHEVNKVMASLFMQMRQKNLYTYVIIPSLFDMDGYFSRHRSRTLLRVVAPEFKRGTFYFYSHEQKMKMLSFSRKYFYNYGLADFQGRFINYLPLGKEYAAKKMEALERLGKDDKELKEKDGFDLDRVIYLLRTQHNLRYEEIIQLFPNLKEKDVTKAITRQQPLPEHLTDEIVSEEWPN